MRGVMEWDMTDELYRCRTCGGSGMGPPTEGRETFELVQPRDCRGEPLGPPDWESCGPEMVITECPDCYQGMTHEFWEKEAEKEKVQEESDE